jgi:hypothetical protein
MPGAKLGCWWLWETWLRSFRRIWRLPHPGHDGKYCDASTMHAKLACSGLASVVQRYTSGGPIGPS